MHQITKIIVSIIPVVLLGSCFKYKIEQPGNVFSESKNVIEYNLDDALKLENVVPAVIVGSGPAGLTASLYIARAGMRSFVFAGPMPCGQLTQTTYIENWPGYERILGQDLMSRMEKQSLSFGTTIIHDSVINIDFKSWPFTVQTEEGRKFKALSVIVATGATPRRLDVPGEAQYWGKGVTTCAVCDAYFYKYKEVVVVGGGDSAAEMVLELAPYVNKVTMLVRKGSMRAAFAMQDKVTSCKYAAVEYYKEVTGIYGDGTKVTAIDVYDNQTGVTERRPMDGVFLAVGHDPNNQLLQKGIDLSDEGYIVMKERSQECSVRGVFAAGEIQDPYYRQAIVAAGEGAKAALDAISFLYDIGFNVDIGKALDQNFYDHFSEHKEKLHEISTIDEFKDQVLGSKGLVVLDFYSDNCPCCMKMLPYLEVVAYQLKDKITILKNNAGLAPRTIFKYLAMEMGIKVRSFPSMLIFKDGQYIELNAQVLNKVQLLDYFNKFIS